MPEKIVKLPKPRFESQTSVEKAILERRSVRDYKDETLGLSDISQIVWAAQGVTDTARGFRAVPSAGATYPLEVYVVSGNVNGLLPGIYKYVPDRHELVKVLDGDKRGELCNAAYGQGPVKEASFLIVISAIYKRTTARYGKRGEMYVHMEAGHLGQNVSLQAISLGLCTVMIGAFSDKDVKRVVNMPKEEVPLYIIPVGRS